MDKKHFGVSFYSEPPKGIVKFDKVIELVNERLHILKVLVSNKEDYSTIKGNPNYYTLLKHNIFDAGGCDGDNFFKILTTNFGSWSEVKEEAYQRDEVSHFLLRLFYCKDDQSTRWFIDVECELLRFRLMEEGVRHQITNFVRLHNLVEYQEFELKGDVEYYRSRFNSANRTKDEILCYNSLVYYLEQTADDIEEDEYGIKFMKYTRRPKMMFKVKFEDALEYISNRRAAPCGGYILIPGNRMIPIICQRWKAEMYRCMKILRETRGEQMIGTEMMPTISDYHDRIIGSINSIRRYLPTGEGRMTPLELVNVLKEQSFPPCMSHVHNSLVQNHHLKHFARLQYALFLKSLGFRLQETMELFRQQFSHRMTDARFDSKYGYFFRYIYGTVGKKRSLSCYSCKKIIDSISTGPQDCHGCPFKQFSSDKLIGFLSQQKLPENGITSIISKSGEREYRSACTTFFHLKNPNSDLKEIIYHPTQFFQASRKAIARRSIQ